jgi:hypothetical protein
MFGWRRRRKDEPTSPEPAQDRAPAGRDALSPETHRLVGDDASLSPETHRLVDDDLSVSPETRRLVED